MGLKIGQLGEGGFRWSYLFLLCLAFLLPFQIDLTLILKKYFSVVEVFANLVVIAAVLERLGSRRRLFVPHPIFWLILGYLLFRFLSALNASNPAKGFDEYYAVFGWMMFFLAGVYGVSSFAEFKRVVVLLVIVSFGVGVLGIVQVLKGAEWTTALITSRIGQAIYGEYIQDVTKSGYLYWAPTLERGLPRAVGTFFYGSPYAIYAGFMLSLAVPLALLYQGVKRQVLFGGSILLFLNILLTQSRGAYVILGVLAVGLITWTFFRSNAGNKVFILASFIVLAFILVFLYKSALPEDLGARINSLFQTPYYQTDRWFIFSSYFKDIPTHLWLGYGMHTLLFVPHYLTEGSVIHAHNLYLQTALNFGVLTLLSLLGVMVSVIVMLWGCFKKYDESSRWLILGSLVGFLWFVLHSFTEYSFNYPQTAQLFWLFCGLAVSLTFIDTNEIRA